jgi:hypothetical protein
MVFASLNPVQKFVYTLFLVFLVTIFVFAFFNLYSIDVFALVIVIEFLCVVQLTRPSKFRAHWRTNINYFIMLCLCLLILVICLGAPALIK